jgi:hypothetical protein
MQATVSVKATRLKLNGSVGTDPRTGNDQPHSGSSMDAGNGQYQATRLKLKCGVVVVPLLAHTPTTSSCGLDVKPKSTHNNAS